MSSGGSRRGRNRSNRNRPKPASAPADFWRAVPEPDVPAPMARVDDPTALIRSLGPPPLPGQAVADRYIGTVIQRAAPLATALLTAVGLVAETERD